MKLAAVLLLVVALPAIGMAQSEPILLRVTLADGRVVAGEVDDATTERQLWLRQSSERVVLAMPYAWDAIALVEVDGQQMTVDQLRDNAPWFATRWPNDFLFEAYEEVTPFIDQCQEQPVAPPRPVSVAFEATLANWDADVEPDGYEIAVTVLDEHGLPTAVRGTLAATLVGESINHLGQPVMNVELGRWSERVDLSDFVGGPAIYRLPFRHIEPEVDVDIAPGALLQIEVGAFGHGRYAASTAVPVREFNAVRDRFQLETGSRFFQGERSERHGRLRLSRP